MYCTRFILFVRYAFSTLGCAHIIYKWSFIRLEAKKVHTCGDHAYAFHSSRKKQSSVSENFKFRSCC